jgi:hypothetical protein
VAAVVGKVGGRQHLAIEVQEIEVFEVPRGISDTDRQQALTYVDSGARQRRSNQRST